MGKLSGKPVPPLYLKSSTDPQSKHLKAVSLNAATSADKKGQPKL